MRFGTAAGLALAIDSNASNTFRKEQYNEALSNATMQYSEVIQEDPNHAEAINNWGAALHGLAETRDRQDALALLQEASGKLEQACEMSPSGAILQFLFTKYEMNVRPWRT